MNQIKANLSNIRSYFHIYAETEKGDGGLKGMSGRVFFSQQGVVGNLNIQLKETVRFVGQVHSQTGEGNSQPVSGAIVTAGSWRTTTDVNGQFLFKALPKGDVSFTVTAKGMEIKNQTFETKELDTPKTIWLFPFIGLSGVFTSLGTAANDPYQANYKVEASSEVRFFRFHNDPAAFGSDFMPGDDLNTIGDSDPRGPSVDAVPTGVRAPWIQIQDLASYNFPGFGRHILYYQFSDATKQDFSPVYQIEVNFVDLDGDYGIIIGDGSETQNSSTLPVTVRAPRTAFMMRYSDGEFGLKNAEWRPVRDLFYFDFTGITPMTTHREVFIQFMDEAGQISGAYSSVVKLEIFPRYVGVTANGGLSTIPGSNALLEFDIPPNAASMRYIIEDGVNNIFVQFDFELLPFLALTPVISESLSPGFPVRTYPIYVQYIDINGNRSGVYRSEIVVDSFLGQYGLYVARPPFLEAPNGIDDDIITQSNFLMGTMVPLDAKEMKIYGPGEEEVATWQDAATVTEYIIRGDGQNYDPFRELYVKFRDLNLQESPAFKRVFKMNLFPVVAPPMMVANHYAKAGEPTRLIINPPINAIEMRINFETDGTGETNAFFSVETWIAVEGNYNIQFETPGIRNIDITFRDALGNPSKSFAISINVVAADEFYELIDEGTINDNGTLTELIGTLGEVFGNEEPD